MLVADRELDVDIEEELEPYLDQFGTYRVRGEKLQACSPFRSETHPSFAVNLETGVFIDSGGSSEEWRKGNFIKLLSFLMGVTYEETMDYLLQKYSTILSDVDSLKLEIQLPMPEDYKVISKDQLEQYAYRNTYLAKRGISEQVQRAFKVGYDRKSQAIVLVWTDKEGRPVNLKFRSIKDKIFWYISGGQAIKKHVYGMEFIHKMAVKRAFVVESEIDALYLWTHKVPAIALGSASMSKQQEALILNSPIESLVLAFDKDNAGNRAKENVSKRLLGKVNIEELTLPKGCKDINDIPYKDVEKAVKSVSTVIPSFL